MLKIVGWAMMLGSTGALVQRADSVVVGIVCAAAFVIGYALRSA